MTHFDFVTTAPGNQLAGEKGLRLACVALLVPALVFVSSCKKKSETENPPAVSPVTVTSAATNPAPPAFQPPAAPVTVAAAPNGGADLKELNHAYIRWIVQSHIRPKTFEEFAAKSGIRVPSAPAGKKYVIDKAGFIALVDR